MAGLVPAAVRLRHEDHQDHEGHQEAGPVASIIPDALVSFVVLVFQLERLWRNMLATPDTECRSALGSVDEVDSQIG